ncbi:MAG: phosphoglucomutase/phosphomannomutase family protein [Candidatus Goldbacteria bacterium]|nr:phosphoglucomutase/phosphomannomutase family protein [Candidatus Goldiibacteriota bacterium]
MATIKFGTDGWRDIIGENFTFANLAKVTDAYAIYMLQKYNKPQIIIGYDNRFLSEKYADFVAQRLKEYGFNILIFDKSVPTPLVSFGIIHLKLNGGIMITSSHNPYYYNGFKIKNENGAGATPDVTKKVEELIQKPKKIISKKGKIESINLDNEYIESIRQLIDINRIKKSNMKIVVDYMYGSAAGYIKKILGEYDKLYEINNYRDPLFGGITPEPIRKNLLNTEKRVRELKADIGIVLDGDGDRMAFIDDRAKFTTTHKALVFILLHHIKNKDIKIKFAKTISGTALLNILTKENNIKLYETPVGFKYIAEMMQKDKSIIGGEESGGIGFGYFMPERDGVLSNLTILEFLAKEGKNPSQIINELNKKYGSFLYDRIDLTFKEKDREKILKKVYELEKKGHILNKKITYINKLDGIKYFMGDNQWLLFRFSGTEPLLRIYSEAPSLKDVRDNLTFGRKLVLKD